MDKTLEAKVLEAVGRAATAVGQARTDIRMGHPVTAQSWLEEALEALRGVRELMKEGGAA